MHKRKIILASGSPRRKRLLEQIGLKFEVRESEYEEDMTLDMAPGELVKFLALGKARDVARHFGDALVIGSDTVVVFKGKVLGKPKSESEAIETLKSLSGREHKVFTGYAIIDTKNNKVLNNFEEAIVKFRDLDLDEINDYLATGEPMDKAGAYGLQEKGAVLVESVIGDYNTVIGLPLSRVYVELRKLGVNALTSKI